MASIKRRKITSRLTQEQKDYLGCAASRAKDESIYPVKFLGSGVQGKAFQACKYGDCDFVVKAERSTSKTKFGDWSVFAQKAAAMGIGPKIVSYGTCQDTDDPDMYVHYTIMRRIPGKPLADIALPWPKELLTHVFDKYARLIIEGGFAQRDLKSDNIMVTPQNRTYIIDYDRAVRVPAHKQKMFLRNGIEWFHSAFFANTTQYPKWHGGRPSILEKTRSPSTKVVAVDNLYSAIEEYNRKYGLTMDMKNPLTYLYSYDRARLRTPEGRKAWDHLSQY
jgi:predicted Ser/Thr protein kinase